MKQTNAMLLIDFYKACHAEMNPKGMTKSVSYFTPRMSRVTMWDKVCNFSLQAFCQKYLIEYFNENFFDIPLEVVESDYRRIMDHTLGSKAYGFGKIGRLHELGYLPIEIISLPEGAMVDMHIPMFGITNTHPDFAWLPQALESLLSAEIWHPMLAATVGHTYREIVNKWFDKTCDDDLPRSRAIGAFDFRGEECLESATKAGAAWCLSFVNTATVPAIPYLEKYYDCDCTKEPVAFGSASTEHSVMCSNYAVDGDEETFLRRILTEIYPDVSFSAVLDSYDYWNVIDNVLPKLKPEIMAHNGCMLMRGDSGDCVDVVTKTVFKLWEHFGGTINSKGYKVLDPHVKAIYGDSITIERIKDIYEILEKNGFACSNVALGVGSFSFQCVEEYETVTGRDANNSENIVTIKTKVLKPFTRDTFSSCVKCTYCEINGVPTPVFKNPKDGGFKKSQKGCCIVTKSPLGYKFTDGHTWEEAYNASENLLKPVFRNGEFIKRYTLKEVRKNLNKRGF